MNVIQKKGLVAFIASLFSLYSLATKIVIIKNPILLCMMLWATLFGGAYFMIRGDEYEQTASGSISRKESKKP